MEENNKIIPNDMMTYDEAYALDQEIVGSIIGIREKLISLDERGGWMALGFNSFREYLNDLGGRCKMGEKYLRRVYKAGLLEEGSGKEIGTFKEGSVRPIVDTLSDQKGFTNDDRTRALEIAIEYAGGDEDAVTSAMAQNAAWYVEVDKLSPIGLERLPERMHMGELAPATAHKLCHLMLSDRAKGIEHIVAECGDYDLAKTLVNLKSTNGDMWQDLQETIERTGYLPTTNGNQIPIGEASNTDLVNHLNEPMRMQRYEKAVDKTEKLQAIAKLAAQMITEYWGIHQQVPEQLKGQETEAKLYAALLELGYIRYGVAT